MREPKWAFLQIMALLTVAIQPSQLRSFFRKIPALVWAVLFYSVAQGYLLQGKQFLWIVPLNFLTLLFLSSSFLSHRQQKAEKFALLFLTVSNFILGFLQILRWDPIFSIRDPRFSGYPAGFMGQHTFYGLLMCLLALVWLAKKQRVLFLLCSFMMLATLSAFSLFSYLAGVFCWMIWRKYYRCALVFLLFSAGCLMAGLALHLNFFYDNGRLIAWRYLLDAVFERPWFGYGLGSFGQEFHLYHQAFGGQPWLQAHNEFLELLFDEGIVGLFLTLAAIILPLLQYKKWWRQEEKLPFFLLYVGLITNALGNFPFHLAPFAFYGMLAYLALLNADRPLLDL